MIKVAYNDAYGYFVLSKEAISQLADMDVSYADLVDLPRHDKRLISVIESMGGKASDGGTIRIAVVSGDRYYIRDECGWEVVETPEDIPWVVVSEEE